VQEIDTGRAFSGLIKWSIRSRYLSAVNILTPLDKGLVSRGSLHASARLDGEGKYCQEHPAREGHAAVK